MTNCETKNSKRTVYTILLSVCLFLGVICACLLVALVLIGRHLAQQGYLTRDCNNTENFDNVTFKLDYLYNADSFSNDTSDEISVKINLTNNNLSTTTVQPDWRSGWRLPRDVRPLHYDLQFSPELKTGKFTGKTNITIQSSESRDHFVLHGEKLDIKKVEMFNAENNEKIDVINFHNDSAHQLWVVDLEEMIKPGVYYLIFEFTGNMLDKRVGMYSSTYLDENENRRYIATSKFEPTYARQAFPCFDEPNYKAEYTVHLQIPKEDGYIALSNMNQIGEPEKIPGDDNHLMVNFNKSVPMSTYVSAYIVCDFKYSEDVIDSISGEKIALKVYATPAQVNKTTYALDIAKRVTEYYEKYFNIEYPLSKLDLIAIPDFVSGAMEHWGLVTYRETALLYSSETSTAANKQRVATVIAHELAHMWFGNLVTLNWWNDLWLNEGFATYMQFKAIHELIPEWSMDDQFLVSQLHSVLNFDSTLATHPIVVTVTTPNQITEIFDSISYNKGASVLRMLENAIGEKKFQTGIETYLKAHKYGNAVTADLWKELQLTDPGFNVKDVMDTWTIQDGYPVVSVAKKRDLSKNLIFEFRQKRFLADPEHAADQPVFKYTWTIPIAYFTNTDSNVKIAWFDKNKETLEINTNDKTENIKWIKLNHRQVGYYRVNYGESLWNHLTLDFEKFNASDKANLLEDSFSIAKAGELRYSIPLEMTEKMINETEYVPWTVTINKFNGLKKFLKSDPKVYKAFQDHVLKIIRPIYDKLGWESNSNADKDHKNSLLRSKILDTACAYDLKEAKTKAQEHFKNWLKNTSVSLNTDIKALIYEYGMERISKEDWEKVFETYLKEIDASEKLKLLNGLASVKDLSLLKTLITRAKNESIVRSQDYFTCLQYISSNEDGTDFVWFYVREHWQELVDRFTINDRYLGQLIPAITSSFVTETRLDEMKQFFEKHPDAGAGEISRKKALETVRNNIKWVKSYQKQVADWLLERQKNN